MYIYFFILTFLFPTQTYTTFTLKTFKGCYTPIFDIIPYIYTLSDPEYYLTFQRKIRQSGTLKYLIFGSFWGPYFYFIISHFYLLYLYFY